MANLGREMRRMRSGVRGGGVVDCCPDVTLTVLLPSRLPAFCHRLPHTWGTASWVPDGYLSLF